MPGGRETPPLVPRLQTRRSGHLRRVRAGSRDKTGLSAGGLPRRLASKKKAHQALRSRLFRPREHWSTGPGLYSPVSAVLSLPTPPLGRALLFNPTPPCPLFPLSPPHHLLPRRPLGPWLQALPVLASPWFIGISLTPTDQTQSPVTEVGRRWRRAFPHTNPQNSHHRQNRCDPERHPCPPSACCRRSLVRPVSLVHTRTQTQCALLFSSFCARPRPHRQRGFPFPPHRLRFCIRESGLGPTGVPNA